MKIKKNLSGIKSKPDGNTGMYGEEFAVLPFSAELELYHILFEKVAKFLIKRYRRSVSMAFDVFKDVNGLDVVETDIDDLDEASLVQFYDWIIHTPGIVKSGYTGIEFYMEKSKQVNGAEMVVLRKMNDSVVTLFQVHLSKSRNKLFFDDLLLNYRCEIDSKGTLDFLNGSLVLARVITLGGKPTLGLGFYPFEIKKNSFLKMIRELFAEYQKQSPDSTLESFLKKKTPLLLLWFEFRRVLNHEDGREEEEEISEIIMYTSLFDVLDNRAVKKRLATIPHFNKFKKDTFEWTGEPGDAEEAELQGIITITNEKMALVTASPELRERGKFLLLSACRGIIHHDTDCAETKYLKED
ncbi:MAG: hypothetical protein Q8O92_03545 [Candidatus Latescibacter sp.]|nr:hypothetical protein [Candidatus Latescibacter sp.]